MPPKYTVETLPDEQFQFVINAIINGDTNREISASFKAEFNAELAKSSLARWREVTGDELAERYKLARFQAKQLLENLDQKDVDKFSVVMSNIEDRLLIATKDVIAQDPIKLLGIQQEERRHQLKREELQLKREALALDKEKLRGAALDRVKLGEEYSADLLEYIGADADGLRWFRKHLKNFLEFIKNKYAAEART
jgi:hypothetical protein